MAISDETMFGRAAELLEADVGDELVALDVKGGQCFGFNPVAASVWKLLDRPRSLAELRLALLDEYDVEPERCTAELTELLATMTANGLTETSEPKKG